MTTLKEVRESGKLAQFVKEHRRDPKGNLAAFLRAETSKPASFHALFTRIFSAKAEHFFAKGGAFHAGHIGGVLDDVTCLFQR